MCVITATFNLKKQLFRAVMNCISIFLPLVLISMSCYFCTLVFLTYIISGDNIKCLN